MVGFLAGRRKKPAWRNWPRKARLATPSSINNSMKSTTSKVPPFKPTAYSGRQEQEGRPGRLDGALHRSAMSPLRRGRRRLRRSAHNVQAGRLHRPSVSPAHPRPRSLDQQRLDCATEVLWIGSARHSLHFFNGHSEAGGGGPHGKFCSGNTTNTATIIDKSLETAKGAKIAVSATRAGDQIKIVASAEVTENGVDQKVDSDKSKTDQKDGREIEEKNDKPKRVLRLALTEESIRYVGGNKLRFHHHVVRAFREAPTARN